MYKFLHEQNIVAFGLNILVFIFTFLLGIKYFMLSNTATLKFFFFYHLTSLYL